MKLILASGSPRRREILSMLGADFEVRVPDIDESCALTDPGARTEAVAAAKCRAVLDALGPEPPGAIVLAADTIVSLDGLFLGKPADEDDARRMLRLLSGRAHEVVSGIAAHGAGRTVTAHERTEVSFAPLSDDEIERYLRTGEPFGKAGAYAVQGWASRFVTGIRGDFFNVVGLPVRLLCQTLERTFGVRL